MKAVFHGRQEYVPMWQKMQEFTNTRDDKTPDEIWFVGDWIRHDIVGAQGAGMTGVWYNPNEAPAEDIVPDIEIKSLLEIPERLHV